MPAPLFQWIASDGSEVLAFRNGGQVGGDGYAQEAAATIRENAAELAAGPGDLMMIYGVNVGAILS